MTRYLVEVPHEARKEACDRAVRVFMETGSHFMTNADWGCRDGVHKAWFIVDADNREEARGILPPLFRQTATIIELQRFLPEDVDNLRRHHEG